MRTRHSFLSTSHAIELRWWPRKALWVEMKGKGHVENDTIRQKYQSTPAIEEFQIHPSPSWIRNFKTDNIWNHCWWSAPPCRWRSCCAFRTPEKGNEIWCSGAWQYLHHQQQKAPTDNPKQNRASQSMLPIADRSCARLYPRQSVWAKDVLGREEKTQVETTEDGCNEILRFTFPYLANLLILTSFCKHNLLAAYNGSPVLESKNGELM